MSIFNIFKKETKKSQAETKKSVKIDKVVEKAKEPKAEKVQRKEKTAGAEKKAESEEKKLEEKKIEKKTPLSKKKNISGILIRPLITEKATNLGQFNQYAFAVALRANKIQVAQAVESRYGVKPIKVNIIRNSGRAVRYGRSIGRTKDTKKAVVILPAGKIIKIHEGV